MEIKNQANIEEITELTRIHYLHFTERIRDLYLEGTASVNLCDPSSKDEYAQFTTVPIKLCLITYEKIDQCLYLLLELIIFNCGSLLAHFYCRKTEKLAIH